MRRLLTLLAAAALLPLYAAAQRPTAFDPFPGGLASAYQFNLARNFYATEGAAVRARDALVAGSNRLAVLVRRVNTGRQLFAALAAADTLMRELGRQYAYLSLRSAIDTRDVAAQQVLSSLAGAVEPTLGELNRVLGSISAAQLAAYTRNQPQLRQYAYAIASARQDNEHRLDSAAEAALGAVEAEATTWGRALFQTTLAATTWGTVRAPEGDLDVRRQGNQIRNHPDRTVCEAGYRLGQAGLASRRDTYAFILTRSAAARNAIARQRRWPDYPTEAYALGALRPTRGTRRTLRQSAVRPRVGAPRCIRPNAADGRGPDRRLEYHGRPGIQGLVVLACEVRAVCDDRAERDT